MARTKTTRTTTASTMKKKRSSLLLRRAAALLLLCAAFGFAADKRAPYALIYGTVFSPSGSLAQGVRVVIRQQSGGKHKYQLVSDRRGEFAQRVPVGPASYLVSIDPGSLGKHLAVKPGKDVEVKIEKDERQDIALHLAP